MNCKYLKVRSKNYKKFFYCSLNKCEIDANCCYRCKNKEYKKQKQLKRIALKKTTIKKSNMAKACEISPATKINVWERDKHKCIFCGKNVQVSCACCHFVPRSHGGLGIEQNIFTACPDCHREQDNGLNSKVYDAFAEKYLKSIYKGCWTKDKLIFRKRRKLKWKIIN